MRDTKDDFDLFQQFEEMFNRRLAEIPVLEISGVGKAEDIAEWYYAIRGYKVYRSRITNGYRCLGTLDYWRDWAHLMEKPGRGKDREMIEMFKSSLPEDELSLLVAAIRDKVGSPDLLLFKEGRLSFVEVKADYETVKPCTVRFFLQYGKNWPLCITRVNCVKAA